jgi:FkbM family methyltransferase
MTRLLRRIVGAAWRRLSPPPVSSARHVEFDPFQWLAQSFEFRTLIDIGANDGAYGAFIARALRIPRAYFFEPQPACQAALRSVAAGVSHAEIFQTALSDQEGETEFLETGYGPSSSLLPPDAQALREFPQNAVTRRFRVPQHRLDDVLADRSLEDDLILKIDVQGLEDKVILGGRQIFRRARVALIEMSFVPLYEGQPLFEEVHDLLVQCGLRFAGIKNQIMMPKTLRPAFAHCIYLRQ